MISQNKYYIFLIRIQYKYRYKYYSIDDKIILIIFFYDIFFIVCYNKLDSNFSSLNI